MTEDTVVVQFQNLDYILLCGLCGLFLRALRLKVLSRKDRKDFAKGANTSVGQTQTAPLPRYGGVPSSLTTKDTKSHKGVTPVKFSFVVS